ncbi:hypothetical protein DL98DRAFT_526878 [Cadophora sp. DSE1049]|nr:hypothetical protein DL98DRAFT_526878 [Cadophora sp. DSE1049]
MRLCPMSVLMTSVILRDLEEPRTLKHEQIAHVRWDIPRGWQRSRHVVPMTPTWLQGSFDKPFSISSHVQSMLRAGFQPLKAFTSSGAIPMWQVACHWNLRGSSLPNFPGPDLRDNIVTLQPGTSSENDGLGNRYRYRWWDAVLWLMRCGPPSCYTTAVLRLYEDVGERRVFTSRFDQVL